MFLAGETEPRGTHLENLVLADLLTWRDVQVRRPEVLYWRTATGLEVDFVIETPKRVVLIEVKTSARVNPDDARGLEAFLDEYGGLASGGLLLHGGDGDVSSDQAGAGGAMVAVLLRVLSAARLRADKRQRGREVDGHIRVS